ncbi:MAG: hypothetical protein CMJ29_05975 [Phycisphaerae bacterium]|nr:hypothetical protein [Phycisphaerae bacterium]|tara:strand:+ start:1573 stop:2064 length:492 start_codon:yes stop_codon:yes gene_type:complete
MRRGGLLLEVLVSIAIFVAAAAFCLRATSDVVTAMDRTEKRLVAADIARSAMSQLQAGTLALADLREGSLFSDESSDARLQTPGAWRVEVQTRPSLRPRLTVVTLTVEEDTGSSTPATFVLRELIELREQDVEAWQEDEMMRDLPEDEAVLDFEDVAGFGEAP